jgi:SAM-dependent methyltransferase
VTAKTFKELEHGGWMDKAGAYDSYFALVTNQAIDAILDSFGTVQGKRLLDVGCGTGHLAANAAQRGAEAEGIAPAVNPEGTLFIVAQILDDSRISPLEALGYNLIFINTFDAGESYTEQEHRAWLSEAGFVHIERAKPLLPDGHGLMTARKPR